MSPRLTRIAVMLAVSCAGPLVEPSVLLAVRLVDLGPADGLALDQPRASVEIFDNSDPNAPVSFGPDFSNTFLLDTGANGIVAVGGAVGELTAAGYETVAVFDEQGVAGFTPMDVSKAYRLDFAGASGLRQTVDATRVLSNGSLNFGGFHGILGMPAMVGRTVTLDMTVWSGGFPDLLGVDFPAAIPADTGHRYAVPLTLIDFPPIGQRQPDDPLPTWAPLPAADVVLGHGGAAVERKFLVDTGAQISIISSATAFALGLDTDGNGSFDEEKVGDLPVGGIGGMVDAPLLALDSLRLPTAEGVGLQWTDLNVAVLDIDPSISGVLGMELFTSGWLQKVLLGGGNDGYIEQMHLDFRAADQQRGTLFLDINPQLDVVQFVPLLGDLNDSGMVDFDDIPAFVLAINDPADYRNRFGILPEANGDLDQSGTVDFDDIGPFVALLGGVVARTAPQHDVPESATLELAGAATLLIVCSHRWGRRG